MLKKLFLQPKQIVIILLVILLLGGSFWLWNYGRRPAQPNPIFLTVWGTEKPEVFGNISGAYAAKYPWITVNYRFIEPRDYEETLTRGLAAGEGPDLALVGGTSLPRLNKLLTPYDQARYTSLDLNQLPNLFPNFIYGQIIWENQLFALPLYSDTLALAYNQNMFDQASVVTPPATWQNVMTLVPTFRKTTPDGKIEKAAIALGGSAASTYNVSDILQLLMVQNGTAMADLEKGKAVFANQSGSAAVNFYLQFADPTSPNYTWSDSLGNVLDRFAEGKVAMMVAFSSDIKAVRTRNPYLRIGVTGMPQTEGAEQTVAQPRVETISVTRQSRNPQAAWDFAVFAATDSATVRSFDNAGGYPPALKTLINEDVPRPEAGVFAKQSLVAQTWRQPNDLVVNQALAGIIDRVVSGQSSVDRAVRDAQDQITATFR